jgi:hypothetical protein
MHNKVHATGYGTSWNAVKRKFNLGEFTFHAVGRQRGMLTDRAETVRSLVGKT